MSTPDPTTIHLWGAKGGVGTSTVAALFALQAARHRCVELRAQDAGGLDELRAILGMPPSDGPLMLGAAGPGLVVIDGGTDPHPPAGAAASFLVTRACYLAMRRAGAADIRPSGVVLVAEPERSLDARDIEDVLGVPVLATIPVTPAVARAIDAGLIAARPPRFRLDAVLSQVAM